MNIWTFLKSFLKINYLIDRISEKDYLDAINVWNVFKMKTVSNYHDLYLKRDLLLLADVSQKFIDTYLEYYGLEHYFSSPGLS